MLYVRFSDQNIHDFVNSSLDGNNIEVPNGVINREYIEVLNFIKNYVSSTLGRDRERLGVDKVDRVYYHLTAGLYELLDTKTDEVLFEGADMSDEHTELEFSKEVEETVEVESTTLDLTQVEVTEDNSLIELLNTRKHLCQQVSKVDRLIEDKSTDVTTFFSDIRDTIDSLEETWNERITVLLDGTTEIDGQELNQFTTLLENIKLLQDRLISTSD